MIKKSLFIFPVDFKPASISSGSEAYIAESQNENDFQVG